MYYIIIYYIIEIQIFSGVYNSTTINSYNDINIIDSFFIAYIAFNHCNMLQYMYYKSVLYIEDNFLCIQCIIELWVILILNKLKQFY